MCASVTPPTPYTATPSASAPSSPPPPGGPVDKRTGSILLTNTLISTLPLSRRPSRRTRSGPDRAHKFCSDDLEFIIVHTLLAVWHAASIMHVVDIITRGCPLVCEQDANKYTPNTLCSQLARGLERCCVYFGISSTLTPRISANFWR